MRSPRPSLARPACDLASVREAFERFGAQVYGSARVMAARAGAPSAEDITVAAFVQLARIDPVPPDAVLGRLLRFAGQAARPLA